MNWKRSGGGEAQQTIAAALLAVFLLPVLALFLSLSSPNDEAMLPACCRTHGKHHCSMRGGAATDSASNGGTPHVSQVSERCPYSQMAPSAFAPVQLGLFAGVSSFIPPNKRLYVMRGRADSAKNIPSCANHKRGPPSSSEDSLIG